MTGTKARTLPPHTSVAFYRSIEHLDDERTYRASHQCECPICGRTYLQHPLAADPHLVGWQGPFLHRLCNGDLVKL